MVTIPRYRQQSGTPLRTLSTPEHAVSMGPKLRLLGAAAELASSLHKTLPQTPREPPIERPAESPETAERQLRVADLAYRHEAEAILHGAADGFFSQRGAAARAAMSDTVSRLKRARETAAGDLSPQLREAFAEITAGREAAFLAEAQAHDRREALSHDLELATAREAMGVAEFLRLADIDEPAAMTALANAAAERGRRAALEGGDEAGVQAARRALLTEVHSRRIERGIEEDPDGAEALLAGVGDVMEEGERERLISSLANVRLHHEARAIDRERRETGRLIEGSQNDGRRIWPELQSGEIHHGVRSDALKSPAPERPIQKGHRQSNPPSLPLPPGSNLVQSLKLDDQPDATLQTIQDRSEQDQDRRTAAELARQTGGDQEAIYQRMRGARVRQDIKIKKLPPQERIVRKGSTPTSIARQELGPNATSSEIVQYRDKILAWNPKLDPNNLQIGDKIRLLEPTPYRQQQAVAAWAKTRNGSRDYQLLDTSEKVGGRSGAFAHGIGAPKCNVFVGDALAAAGIDARDPTNPRLYLTTKAWADPSRVISGFRILGPGEELRPGDIITNGEHIGIYYPGADGKPMTVSAADMNHGDKVVWNEWGFRGTEGKIVVRRYVGTGG